MKKMFCEKAKQEEKAVGKVKSKWNRFIEKTTFVGASLLVVANPVKADAAGAATAPSAYVNKITDGLFGEIMNVAPKIALVVVAWGLIMYLAVGDEHKKSKYKTTAFVALAAYGILLVLEPLLGWFGGLIN